MTTSTFEFLSTEIPGLLRIKPRIFGDHRGFFQELYHAERFAEGGITLPFVQDNLSRSQRGVLRGLHYQIDQPQGKLVTCLQGAIFDVAVDLRQSSPQFGQWSGTTLTSENREAFYIPPGFAHGFYVLSESADVLYKCTNLYSPDSERTVLWNDPAIAIDWPLEGEPKLSSKDLQGRLLEDSECYD